MDLWKTWKQGFDAWEKTTAAYLDKLLQNPAVLTPSGAMLTAAMRAKAASDRVASMWWAALGLPTKADQERGLHKLNQIESRLLDLEERLAELQER
jgi:hypothetical protein